MLLRALGPASGVCLAVIKLNAWLLLPLYKASCSKLMIFNFAKLCYLCMQVMPDVNRVLAQMRSFTEVRYVVLVQFIGSYNVRKSVGGGVYNAVENSFWPGMNHFDPTGHHADLTELITAVTILY